MNKIKIKLPILIVLLISVHYFSGEPQAKFYKYIDKDGHLRFVDGLEKIPPEYMDQITTYKEKRDYMSEEQKAAYREKQRENQEKRRREQLEQERELEEQKRQEEIEKQKLAKEKFLKSLETKVIISGKRILVPVKLAYDGKEEETHLLLDTGATNIVLNMDVADRLGIKDTKRGFARVADGKVIEVRLATLKYVEIGPFTMPDAPVSIIRTKGPALSFSGYLGMDFLRNVKYTVDYKNQMIRWEPEIK